LVDYVPNCQSQWPRGLRRRSAAARLLRLWVRIPQKAWLSVCCECCVLSGKGLCDEPMTCPEESYRMWCVVVCDLETSWLKRPWPTWGCHTRPGLTETTGDICRDRFLVAKFSIFSPVWGAPTFLPIRDRAEAMTRIWSWSRNIIYFRI